MYPLLAMECVFFEGMPGSGKSTSAENFARSNGCPVYGETDPSNPLLVGELDPQGAAMRGIENRYSPSEFARASLSRYQQFMNTASDVRHVFESYPLQTGVRVLLQINADMADVDHYWDELVSIIEKGNPRLVFFEYRDLAGSLREIVRHRGPQWEKYVVEAMLTCPYAVANGLAGLDGVLAMFAEYDRVCHELLGRWPYPLLVLDGAPPDYERRDARVREWLMKA